VTSISILPTVTSGFLNKEPVKLSQNKKFRCQLRYSVTTLLTSEQQQRINQLREEDFLNELRPQFFPPRSKILVIKKKGKSLIIITIIIREFITLQIRIVRKGMQYKSIFDFSVTHMTFKIRNTSFCCLQSIIFSSVVQVYDSSSSKGIILSAVLYGCETWSLTFREERRLRVFLE
jgi:hypothetical protein